MRLDDFLNEEVFDSVKTTFVVTFETETYDDGDVAVFVSDNNGYFQYSKVFKDLKSAKVAIKDAKDLFKRKPWNALEELKLNGFEEA